MKKTKALLIPLLIFGLVGLSGCSLFNDDDIAIHNEYNPPEDDVIPVDPTATYVQGVKGKENVETVPNAYVWKNIPYAVDGKITNTYKVGGTHQNEFNVNGGQDYEGTKTNNNYDLYVPKADIKNSKHVVILFIHGGAWVTGFKSQVEPYVNEFVNRGFITANIKYTLLKREMNDNTLSIFRNLDEIDACITNIKVALHELFEKKEVALEDSQLQLVIGGVSSGAHLSMLYTYSRGNDAALVPQLVINAVGPVNIQPAAWKKLAVDSGEHGPVSIEKDSGNVFAELPIADEKDDLGNPVNWNDYQTMRIANGMCGIPNSLDDVKASSTDKVHIDNPNAASTAMTKANGGEDQLSVTHYMSATSKTRMVCAYAGKDSVVGVNQFATLQTTMDTIGVPYQFTYFRDCGHTDLNTNEAERDAYNEFLGNIIHQCEALLA